MAKTSKRPSSAKKKSTRPSVKKSVKKHAAGKSAVAKNAKPGSSKKATKSATKRLAPQKSAGAKFAGTQTRTATKSARRKGESSVERKSAPLNTLASVPTDGKPLKNQAGLGSRDLEHYRELLLAKRRELAGDMTSMEQEALRNSSGTNLSSLPIHMADMGTDNYEQEFTLGLMEKDRNLLREIYHALAKIQNGTFGLCEGTSKPISRPRLEAQPWARHSIEYARKLEKRSGYLRIDHTE